LPKEIKITSDISVSKDADVTIIATPSFAVAETAKKLREIGKTGIVVNVAKGFENGTKLRLSQVIERELPEADVVVLSGPSHA
jgi:glycerol-3-phosphate dehydrogenase (NAD(P)+)